MTWQSKFFFYNPSQIDGQCDCKPKVQSRRCNQCIDGYFNLNKTNPDGCEKCLCDLRGTRNRTITCDAVFLLLCV